MKSGEDPRVRFAAERTLLAWIRTGLALMGFGFVLARFGLFLAEIAAVRQEAITHTLHLSWWIGMALVILGVVMIVLAAHEHWQIIQRLNRGEAYRAPRWSLGLVMAGMLAILGMGMVGYLVLVGQ